MKRIQQLIIAILLLGAGSMYAKIPGAGLQNSIELNKWKSELQERKVETINREKFYTGRPFDQSQRGFVFKFRNYDPRLSRWTAVDPSGFPDGPNNWLYVNNSATSRLDPDGLDFLHFDGSNIIHYDGSGYQSGGNIDWGSEVQRWSAVSGSSGATPIPDGWYSTSGPMQLGGIQANFFPERSVREGDILFAGTMSIWDQQSGTGYGNYLFNAYGGASRFGYDTQSGGVAPQVVEYKIG